MPVFDAAKVGSYLLVFILFTGVALKYRHQVYQSGYNDAMAFQAIRDADTLAQSHRLMVSATVAYQEELNAQEKRHAHAMHIYSERIDALRRDAVDLATKRMFIATKTQGSNCNSGTLPTREKSVSGVSGENTEIQLAELTARDSRSLQDAAVAAQELNLACQAILDELGY